MRPKLRPTFVDGVDVEYALMPPAVQTGEARAWYWSYRAIVFVTSLSLFNFGYNTASISGALLYIDLQDIDCRAEEICLTNSFEKGCVVSSCLMGAVFGALLAGSLADWFGRRAVLLANNLFYILGPIGMAFAASVEFLVAARAVTGIGVGISSALVHVYISEVVPAARRGEHGALLVMMGTGGILASSFAAYWLQDNWRTVLGVAVLPALLQVILGPFVMPESPRWLQTRVQLRLQASGLDLSLDSTSEPRGAWQGLLRDIVSGQARKPLIIGIGLQILQQVSGINVAVYYGPKIFTFAHFSERWSIFLSGAVSLAQVVATLLLAKVIDRVGRRPMNFAGLTGMAVSLCALGTAFRTAWAGSGWLALFAVLMFRISFSVSLGPLPYIITAEIFPSSCRAAGVSLCWAVNWASNFIVSLTFLPLLGTLTASGIFYMYAGVCVFAVGFVKVCVPETKGQTLEQLENTIGPSRTVTDSLPGHQGANCISDATCA